MVEPNNFIREIREEHERLIKEARRIDRMFFWVVIFAVCLAVSYAVYTIFCVGTRLR